MFALSCRMNEMIPSSNTKRYYTAIEQHFSKSFYEILKSARRLEETTNIKEGNKETLIKVEDIFKNAFRIMKEIGFNPNKSLAFSKKMPLDAGGRSFFVTSGLLNIKALPNQPNEYQETPLFLASLRNQFEVAQLLIHHGADVLQRSCIRGSNPSLPIHVATTCKMLNLFIKSGASVNGTSLDYVTALEFNVICIKPECVEFLLNNGAKDHTNARGKTALKVAEELKQSWAMIEDDFNKDRIEKMNKIIKLLKI